MWLQLAKKHQNKKLISQLKSLNDFVNGNNANAEAAENEAVETETGYFVGNFERLTVGENNTSHDEVVERKISDRSGKVINSVVKAVEIRVHEAIWTAMDNIVIPRVEMAVRSITGSSERGPIRFIILSRDISQGSWKRLCS